MTRKRTTFCIIALLLLLFSGLGIWNTLRSAEEYVPENTVSAMDNTRSQVLVSGKDYRLDNEQKQKHEEQEDKRSEAIEIRRSEEPEEVITSHEIVIRSEEVREDTGGGNGNNENRSDNKKEKKDKAPKVEDPDDINKKKDDNEGMSEEDRKKLPTIKTSVIKGEHVNATKYDIWVTATDYKGRNIPVKSVGDGSFKATINGGLMASTGADGNQTFFRPTLIKGSAEKPKKNTIVITATDREGRTNSVTTFIFHDPNVLPEGNFTVSVSITAKVINKGTIIGDTDVELEKGSNVKDALDGLFSKTDAKGVWSGSYLAGVEKNGIASGASISDSIMEKLEEERITPKDPKDLDPNRLKEEDLTSGSGWLVKVNGDLIGVGTTSKKLNDGDTVELLFCLSPSIY